MNRALGERQDTTDHVALFNAKGNRLRITLLQRSRYDGLIRQALAQHSQYRLSRALAHRAPRFKLNALVVRQLIQKLDQH